jgi:predicted small metal-binding protein
VAEHELPCCDCLDPQCDFVAIGATDDEVTRHMLDHLRGHHTGVIEGRSIDEQRAQVRSWIQTFAR